LLGEGEGEGEEDEEEAGAGEEEVGEGSAVLSVWKMGGGGIRMLGVTLSYKRTDG